MYPGPCAGDRDLHPVGSASDPRPRCSRQDHDRRLPAGEALPMTNVLIRRDREIAAVRVGLVGPFPVAPGPTILARRLCLTVCRRNRLRRGAGAPWSSRMLKPPALSGPGSHGRGRFPPAGLVRITPDDRTTASFSLSSDPLSFSAGRISPHAGAAVSPPSAWSLRHRCQSGAAGPAIFRMKGLVGVRWNRRLSRAEGSHWKLHALSPRNILITARGVSVTPQSAAPDWPGNGSAGDPAGQWAGPEPAHFRRPRGRSAR